jgi:putative inorganic carbon (HCO3(-)) transporter
MDAMKLQRASRNSRARNGDARNGAAASEASVAIPRTKIFTQVRKSTLAYRALVFFAVIYFTRPEDYIPGLDSVPIAKIAGGIALLALVFGIPASQRQKLPVELKVLLLLLVHMLLCIPFASWRGGSYDAVVNKFSKGVLVAILVFLVATTLVEIRRLLYIQAATIAAVTVISIFVHHTLDGRLMGYQKGILENPNDLAINIAINFPLCLALLLAAKGAVRKAIWGVGLVFMLWGVVATYSRSGLLAVVVTIAICLWEFGVKGKRTTLLMVAVLGGVVGLGVMVATPKYLVRVESIVRGNIEGSGDRGSLAARQELLKKSLLITLRHPFFGIGPGDFASYTQEWRVVHNTYAEIGAETGLPGAFLFLTLMWLSLRKIRRIKKLPGYAASEDIRLWTSALWAGMAAYVSGALFASTEYNLFPYFMVGYICALYQIASRAEQYEPQPEKKKTGSTGPWSTRLRYDEAGKRQLVRNR